LPTLLNFSLQFLRASDQKLNLTAPIMQHLKEFLTRIQTFNLRITKQQVGIEKGKNDTKEMDACDITRETQYYDSFSYKSELRVLKDMAFLDILALDKECIAADRSVACGKNDFLKMQGQVLFHGLMVLLTKKFYPNISLTI
jgi:hypothetical protein